MERLFTATVISNLIYQCLINKSESLGVVEVQHSSLVSWEELGQDLH